MLPLRFLLVVMSDVFLLFICFLDDTLDLFVSTSNNFSYFLVFDGM